MRFDTEAVFVRETPGAYNAATGDYDDGSTTKEPRLADATDASEQTMMLVYGKIKQGALVLRIQGKKPKPFDYILINSERHKGKYRVDSSRYLRTKCVFVVSEVQT